MEDLDTLMRYAKKRLLETEISKLDDAILIRLHEWILSVLKEVANKIPSLTPIIDEKIGLFWNWDIQCFFDVDFASQDYRKWLAETNIVVFNFLLMDVQNKMGTITVKCRNKVRFGFCACAFYIALKNGQRDIEEEIRFRGLDLNAYEDKQIKNYPKELVKLFHNNISLIDKLVGLSDDDIAKKINQWANERDEFGKPLIENPENRLKEAFATALKTASIIKCTISTFRKKL